MTDGLCGAQKTDGSGTCRHRAGWGTDHVGYGQCRKHGGATRNGRRHGQKAAAQQAIHRLEGQLTERLNAAAPNYDNPIEGLLEVVARTGAMMRMCGDLVGQLAPGRNRRDQDVEGLYGPDHLGDDTSHVLVDLYGTWSDRHAKACKAAVDAGVAEAYVRIAQRQGELIVKVIEGVLDDLGVDRTPEVTESVGRHLRLVGS